MRALLERLGAIQEECNECRRRWEQEKAAADVARNGQAQAQAEAAQVRRGLQQTIATLKKSEKSLKAEVQAQCEAKDALLRTVEALEAANTQAETEREEHWHRRLQVIPLACVVTGPDSTPPLGSGVEGSREDERALVLIG